MEADAACGGLKIAARSSQLPQPLLLIPSGRETGDRRGGQFYCRQGVNSCCRLTKATEQKGEELFGVLQNLKNEALALKKKAEELAADVAGRDRASGGRADGSARRGAEKGQEGAKADGKSV